MRACQEFNSAALDRAQILNVLSRETLVSAHFVAKLTMDWIMLEKIVSDSGYFSAKKQPGSPKQSPIK